MAAGSTAVRPGRIAPDRDRDRIDDRGARCKAPADPLVVRRAWTAVLLAYLLVTLPLLLAGGGAGQREWLLAVPLHLALVGWTWLVRRGRTDPVADWTFPLALPFLYAELPLLMEGLPGVVAFHDATVAAFETAVFGGQPAFEWASALPVPWVSELLHLGYLSYYPLIFVPPLLLWAGLTGPADPVRRREAFHRTILALSLAMLPAFALMVVWPVQGPRYFGPPAGIPEGPVRDLVLAILGAGSSRGAAFPSSHVSLAVAQTVVALRWQRPVGIGAAVVTLLLGAGAVYGGFHYLLDVLAGALLGAVAAAVALGTGMRSGSDSHPPDGVRETPSAERG